MSQFRTKPIAGTRDFLPNELRVRRHVIHTIQTTFEQYGFQPIETPSIESLDVLLGKYGDEGDKLLYRLLLRKEALSRAIDSNETVSESTLSKEGLRYDLTLPFSRIVAEHQGTLPKYFRRYQIQPVWRADRPAKGRFREFYQCDIDAIGSTNPITEHEVCATVCAALSALEIGEFAIRVNHRGLLRDILNHVNVPVPLQSSVLISLDKIDKIGPKEVIRDMNERGLDANIAEQFTTLCTRYHDMPRQNMNSSILTDLTTRLPSSEALTELTQFTELAEKTGLGKHLKIDLSLARGLGYYTGCIFEIESEKSHVSIGGGGRYDQLIGQFTKNDIPSVGFSIGLERIIPLIGDSILNELDNKMTIDVFICHMTAATASVLSIADSLRQTGLKVEVFPESGKKLSKQLEYAAKKEISARFAGIIGDNELQKGTMQLKNLATGEQTEADVSEICQLARPE